MAYPSGGKAAFPGFGRVYYARNPGAGVFVAQIDVSLEQAFGLLRAEFTPPRPVKARWVYGRRRPSDFVWTSFAAPIIVSQKVLHVLREHKVTGWSTYDVALSGAEGERLLGYSGLSIIGRCGAIQHDHSQEIQKPGPVGNTIIVYKGLYFDADSWDGSDLFVPEADTGLLFVVDRVVTLLTAANVGGVEFDRADTHESYFP